MEIKELSSFFLVGGTCLALRYGHRFSLDLDLFSIEDFKNEELIQILNKECIPFEYSNINNPIGLFGYIDEVKVDFVNHSFFSQIDDAEIIEGIRMFSDKDIIAMKIFAMLKRAAKKDFWDLAELLQHYSLEDCVVAYYKKYPSQQLHISIPHAITYFTDADESEDPISLKNQTWESVKKIIQESVKAYLA